MTRVERLVPVFSGRGRNYFNQVVTWCRWETTWEVKKGTHLISPTAVIFPDCVPNYGVDARDVVFGRYFLNYVGVSSEDTRYTWYNRCPTPEPWWKRPKTNVLCLVVWLRLTVRQAIDGSDRKRFKCWGTNNCSPENSGMG